MSDMQPVMDKNLAESIAMLEQILEVMPQDYDAMKTLYSAYSNCGNRDRAFEYLCRMAQVAVSDEDAEGMAYTRQELNGYASENPDKTADILSRFDRAERGRESAVPVCTPVVPVQHSAASKEMDVSEELALAWMLYEGDQLSQEEYSTVLHDLTEVSSKELDVPVSVMHVLHDRGFAQLNRILNYLSNRSGVPCISLERFELMENVARSLPINIAAHEGALPFAYFGDDLLVGVLNPFNKELVERIEAESGKRCHTYLVASDDYDAMLGKLRQEAA